MVNNNCLNCNEELTGNFCAGCGQKADTHRISFKNFIFHDLLHGTFHIEKGILFTAKQSLTRPGQAALDYIAGKRKRYYNVFLLVLLIYGVMLFTRHVDEMFTHQSGELIPEKVYLNEATQKLDELISKKSKLLLLLFVPFAAINSFVLFRRKKLNISEHFIIAGMVLLGVLILSTFANLLFQVNLFMQLSTMILSLLVAALIVLYIGLGYINAFGADYSKPGMAYRIVLFFAFFCLEIVLLTYILVGIVTHWDYSIPVTIAPFG